MNLKQKANIIIKFEKLLSHMKPGIDYFFWIDDRKVYLTTIRIWIDDLIHDRRLDLLAERMKICNTVWLINFHTLNKI